MNVQHYLTEISKAETGEQVCELVSEAVNDQEIGIIDMIDITDAECDKLVLLNVDLISYQLNKKA